MLCTDYTYDLSRVVHEGYVAEAWSRLMRGQTRIYLNKSFEGRMDGIEFARLHREVFNDLCVIDTVWRLYLNSVVFF